MRSLFFVFACFLCFFSLQAQNKTNVPDAVLNAFKKIHPDVTSVEWKKETVFYEAEFEIKETEQTLLFDEKGTLIESEIEIVVTELPAAVKEYIYVHCSGKQIDEASKITKANGTILYEAEVNKKDFLFDEKGTFIEIKKD